MKQQFAPKDRHDHPQTVAPSPRTGGDVSPKPPRPRRAVPTWTTSLCLALGAIVGYYLTLKSLTGAVVLGLAATLMKWLDHGMGTWFSGFGRTPGQRRALRLMGKMLMACVAVVVTAAVKKGLPPG